jgi:hypothetical protein
VGDDFDQEREDFIRRSMEPGYSYRTELGKWRHPASERGPYRSKPEPFSWRDFAFKLAFLLVVGGGVVLMLLLRFKA